MADKKLFPGDASPFRESWPPLAPQSGRARTAHAWCPIERVFLRGFCPISTKFGVDTDQRGIYMYRILLLHAVVL